MQNEYAVYRNKSISQLTDFIIVSTCQVQKDMEWRQVLWREDSLKRGKTGGKKKLALTRSWSKRKHSPRYPLRRRAPGGGGPSGLSRGPSSWLLVTRRTRRRDTADDCATMHSATCTRFVTTTLTGSTVVGRPAGLSHYFRQLSLHSQLL